MLKFLNFYNIFLKGKQRRNTFTERKLLLQEIKEEEEEKKENQDEKDFIHDNIEINENVELEYEIKLPQFLIDYSEKTNKIESKNIAQLISKELEEENNDKNDDNENESLLKSEHSIRNQKTKKYNQREHENNSNVFTPAPTPTPTPTPTPDGENPNNDGSLVSNSNISKEDGNEKNMNFKRYSQEEKLYKTRMNQYKTLFNEGKIDELEELIDNCNKNSSSIEYRFNFTFDKYLYGNKQISYIVRCVDTKNDLGKSDEESEVEQNPRLAKYKKEKNKSIQPLFELLENERKEIVKLPEEFLKLSLENKKFQKLLQICKNDISNMSKAYGHKKDQIIEDENSSQSSQAGYDSGLLKKNRIEEIRSNLMKNISGFYSLKYFKFIILMIIITDLLFSVLYISIFNNLTNHLKNTFTTNITLFQSAFWTSEIVNIFISLRVLYQKYIIKEIEDIDILEFYDYLADSNRSLVNLEDTNKQYYNQLIEYTKKLYNNTYASLGKLESDLPKFLKKEELNNYFWNTIKVNYMNDFCKVYPSCSALTELFPMSLFQFLTNTLSYIEDNTFNSLSDRASELFNKNINKNTLFFKHTTSLIIENGYNNILPNQFKILTIIPNLLSNYNLYNKTPLRNLIYIYAFLLIILVIAYILLFFSTNKSLTDGVKKMAKIRLEKIEEIIKKIKIFGINLKKYRENDSRLLEDNKNISDSTNSFIYNNLNNKHDGNIIEKEKKKKEQENSVINNNGFATDYKKYVPLKILNHILYPPLLFLAISVSGLIPLYMLAIIIINRTNSLLLVQNYIYGKLITTNAKIIDIKCFIIDCNNEKTLDYNNLVNMSLIQNIMQGINYLPAVANYYNEKFLLDACGAAIDQEMEPNTYINCFSDLLILTANNTDNLMKLIENYVNYLEKENEAKSNDTNYKKIILFNSTYFRDIEYIYSKYISNINNIFKNLITIEYVKYLYSNVIKNYLWIILVGFTIFIFWLGYGTYILKKLVYYLTISRCIMKIIPISIILNTQELEAWIENKY